MGTVCGVGCLDFVFLRTKWLLCHPHTVVNDVHLHLLEKFACHIVIYIYFFLFHHIALLNALFCDSMY